MADFRASNFEHIMELRNLINSITSPTKFGVFFIKTLKTELKISEELLEELLNPCWGHFDHVEGDDQIDGPDHSFKINCPTCVKMLLALRI